MFAKDIMTTQVLTVTPETTIKEAMKLLVEIQISGLIVADGQQEIIGILSEKDLLVAYDFLQQIMAPVAEYVNRDVISVKEDTPIEEVSRILFTGDIRRVPVLKGAKVVGVVSRRDILRHILQQTP